jgi:hypothetical protein
MGWPWRGFWLGLVALLVLPLTASAQVSTSVGLSVTVGQVTGDIRFVGDAFPSALVTLLKNGSVAATTAANGSSVFNTSISGLNPGVYTFGLYAQDNSGHKTLTLSFDINIITGMTITVSGILLSPIAVVPESIKRPESLTESGLAKNNSTVTTFTHSDPITKQTTSDASGNWVVKITNVLHLGSHSVNALVQDNLGNQSAQTAAQNFEVKLSADLNVDNLVNLTDFSILMFGYGVSPPPNLAADINDEGHADLVDFSIMMFYWSR